MRSAEGTRESSGSCSHEEGTMSSHDSPSSPPPPPPVSPVAGDGEDAGSIYSMDSFVEDAHQTDEEDYSMPPPPNHYFSPTSSTSASDHEPATRRAGPPLPTMVVEQPKHHRRESSGLHTASGSDSLPPVVPPAHPFFSPSFYDIDDSDIGEGSVVFHTVGDHLQLPSPRTTPTKRSTRRHRGNKDKFPSFDSLGSSGSVRHVSPRASSQQQQQQPPIQPQLLPYHERRKLMLQREQQEAPASAQPPPQQQQPAPMAPYPGMPMPTYDMGGYPAYPPPQQHQQQPMMPMQPYPGRHLAPYPMAGPPLPMNMYPYPLQPQMPGALPVFQPPAAPMRAAPPQQQPQQQQQQQQPVLQQPPPQQQPRPSNSRPPASGKPGSNRPRPSTQPSLPRPPPPSQRNRARTLSDSSTEGGPPRPASRREGTPPPPPPPIVPPPGHVRQDSTGSVSSLGSVDRSSREDDAEEARGLQVLEHQSLFRRLNPFAPKEPSVDDFHRKNQEFLSRMDRQSQVSQSPVQNLFKAPSPRQQQQVKQGPVRRAPPGPPPSRGSHRRLPSIDNDDWTEDGEEDTGTSSPDAEAIADRRTRQIRHARQQHDAKVARLEKHVMEGRSSPLSSSASDVDDASGLYEDFSEPDEQTRLLPPSGISTNEYYDKSNADESRGYGTRQASAMSGQSRAHRGDSSRRPDSTSTSRSPGHYFSSNSNDVMDSMGTHRMDNTTATALLEYQREMENEARRKKKKKKKRRKYRSRRSREARPADDSDNSVSSSSASSQDHHYWMSKRAKILEKERAKLIKQWRDEARAEEEAAKKRQESNRWYRRVGRHFDFEMEDFVDKSFKFFGWLEAFIANLPLTIGAIALAIANLGVDWFKFAEENMNSCMPVHFHSSQCTFPEFPGCFYCDKDARMYKLALRFHWTCSAIAGILAFTFVAKLILARRVVFDELSSPTTASPAGLICMALAIVFAGRGFIGMVIVSAASTVHLCLAIWFIYMSLAYHIMPDPSWFPNTVGIGISAVKTWLYFPTAGHFLMAISLSLNFFFFPISLIRVALNKKISATVGWMQMSAPNISLYALTIMAQPSFEEEHPDVTSFQKVHRMVYLPCMHFLFSLCLIGMAASICSLIVRWKDFKRLPFSPAHAAFCCPTLSHANAVQAYRAAVKSFSDLPAHSPFRIFLYTYWAIVLAAGTILTLIISTKFMMSLPKWTHIDTEGEIEPPAPYETSMTLSNMIATGETLVQPFVSPAVLQANETGALYLTRDQAGEQRYVRTRKVTALGFEPIMDIISMERERDVLLDWVGKHPPRRRHRTLSVPGIDFNYGAGFGTGNVGVFGMDDSPSGSQSVFARRPRSSTMSPRLTIRRGSDH